MFQSAQYVISGEPKDSTPWAYHGAAKWALHKYWKSKRHGFPKQPGKL